MGKGDGDLRFRFGIQVQHGLCITTHEACLNPVQIAAVREIIFHRVRGSVVGEELLRCGNVLYRDIHTGRERIRVPLDGEFRLYRRACVDGEPADVVVVFAVRVGRGVRVVDDIVALFPAGSIAADHRVNVVLSVAGGFHIGVIRTKIRQKRAVVHLAELEPTIRRHADIIAVVVELYHLVEACDLGDGRAVRVEDAIAGFVCANHDAVSVFGGGKLVDRGVGDPFKGCIVYGEGLLPIGEFLRCDEIFPVCRALNIRERIRHRPGKRSGGQIKERGLRCAVIFCHRQIVAAHSKIRHVVDEQRVFCEIVQCISILRVLLVRHRFVEKHIAGIHFSLQLIAYQNAQIVGVFYIRMGERQSSAVRQPIRHPCAVVIEEVAVAKSVR